jgi:PLP dependent protein
LIAIEDNLAAVRQRIEVCSKQLGRKPASLLAVSKGQPASAIRRAFVAGQSEFAESYLQEALAKIAETADLNIIWHFIGPIQSNKTAAIAEYFSWVHGIDRVKIAERLSGARPADMQPLNVCLQVNISGEASKSGVEPDKLRALAAAVSPMPSLKLRGLMTIPEPSDDLAEQRRAFHRVRTLYDSLRRDGYDLDTLSMGMSRDLESAIAEGATIVRIGTAIFGPRD